MRLMPDKLAPPLLPPTTVARERLNDHFVLDERIRVLVIHAPPGYGKTTLLAERLPALEQAASWLRLDPQDNVPLRFIRYFEAALGTLFREHLQCSPPSSGDSTEYPDVSLEDTVETWLSQLPGEAKPCRLVIDEFEHITNPEILAGLMHWLRHQPPWLTLTLVSRTWPSLGLPALRLRGELEEVGVEALAFDHEEAQTLCAEQLIFPPSRVSLERALRLTEGWIMALNWLVERTTTRAGFDALLDRMSGAHPDFVAWFDDLLSGRADDDDRQLLLQLGVLERFSPQLVARLLEGDRITQRLEALDRAGLFLYRLSPDDQWWRFHPLFAQYLCHRRHEMSLDSQHQLHRRASAAWLALGKPDLALAQAINADQPAALATLIEHHGPHLLANGHFALLARAMETLGEARLSASPRLTLIYGWVTHAQYQFDRTERTIGWIEAQLDEPDWQALAAEFATLRAQLAINQGDAERAAPLAQQALTLPAHYLDATPVSAGAIYCEARFVQGQLEESLARIQAVEQQARHLGDDQLILWTLCHHSETLVAQGRLQAAFDIQERAFAHIEHCGLDRLPVAEFLYRIRSQLLWEWHRLDEAEQAALKGIAVLDSQGEAWTLQCHVGLAKVALARGDQAHCTDHIRRLRKILAEGDYHIDWRANAHAILLAWWQANDDRDAVTRWLQEAPAAELDTASNHFAQANVRNHARALMLLDRPEEARPLLEALEEQTQHFGLITDANRNQLCLAALEWQCDHRDAALRHMSKALDLATRTALTGSFLRLGKPLHDMLTALLETHELDGLARERAKRLIMLAGRQRDFGRAVRLMLDDTVIADIVTRPDVPELIRTSPLTRREWQILGLIHAGLSNEQIAEQLSVAPTTIKTHIRSLYQKQNIRRREEAIALAGDLLGRIQGE
ncbi:MULTISPECIES: HTH-type transcriptional regulator MalT [Halomonadaceae]|uniref:HTH-type transcriptional regulator MalT n=1 Tax=Halomonadaceae TaxID=28256 RepID=UPI00158335A6|nr:MULTISPECIES: HTH-type transcriptional regulator MalT [Halomonas]MDI4638649.1 HTH-type transcriptional regulator MalT [Halomonas sp. BMC7]NUJ59635.1 HTH-type transcriptional regulator MalT [Halomonas taeanensis]